MGTHAEEPMARVGISRILEKVTAMEAVMAVQASAIQAIVGDIKELRTDVGTLNENRFPWKVIGGMAALGALVVAIVASFMSGNPPPPR